MLASGTVTFLLTDIEGSTRLWEQYPEGMHVALARHDTILRQAIEAHGGAVFKTVGDAFLAAFPTAPAALAAALSAQRCLFTEPWEETGPLRVRMALHTGVAFERDGDYFGPTLNRAARLLAVGHGGQILLSQPACDLVRDHLAAGVTIRNLGEQRLRDLTRPEHVFQLVAPELPAEFPPLKTLTSRPNNLPLLRDALIGREKEIAAAQALLLRPDVALVTLTGPGGAGKTRLALQVAADLIDDFADGVFFVNLAPLFDPTLILTAIAQPLDVREQGNRPLLDSVKDYLRDKQALLVMDNFEHLASAAPVVTDLLTAAPKLKVLVTSRVLLRLRGEFTFTVPPLTLPSADAGALPAGPGAQTWLARLAVSEAVRLFVVRAQAASVDFALTPDNGPAIAEICHRLDGLPLAIELAAARIRLLPPQAMRQRLGQRLQWLTGGQRDLPTRHQTLRDMLAWSYNLLEEAEKRLFRRLAVFLGGFSLEAVEAVCNAGSDLGLDVLDGIASLLDKSLVVAKPASERQPEATTYEPRFTLLETIREYALERLTDRGELETTRRQHLDYYVTLAEAAQTGLTGPEALSWLDRLETEHDNLRAALRWAASAAAAGGLRLASALVPFWDLHGGGREGCDWLATALTQARVLGDRHAEWQVLLDLGKLWAARNYTLTGDYYQQALALARQMGDAARLAHSLNCVGNWHTNVEQPNDALRCHTEARVIFMALGDRRGEAGTLDHLGLAANHSGNMVDGARYFTAVISLRRELNDQQGLSSTLATRAMGTLHYATETLVSASTSLIDAQRDIELAVNIAREIGWRSGEAYARFQLAACLGFVGEYTQALNLAHDALEITEEIEHRQWMTAAVWCLGILHLDLLALPEARDKLERALGMAQELGSAIWTYFAAAMLARTLTQQREYVAAEATLDAVLARDAPTQTLLQRLIWGARAELALARGTPAQALHIVDQMLATAQNLEGRPISAIPRLAYLRGQALAGLKRPAEAELALQAAAEGAATRGPKSLLWRVHIDLGRLHLAEGRGAEAQREFAAARTLIDALAAHVADTALRKNFVLQAHSMFPPLVSGTTRQVAKAEFGGLTEREREVAALIGQGKTNREIAEGMVLGRRTVETHINNMLAKLGFTARAQIIAWAMEKGLVNKTRS